MNRLEGRSQWLSEIDLHSGTIVSRRTDRLEKETSGGSGSGLSCYISISKRIHRKPQLLPFNFKPNRAIVGEDGAGRAALQDTHAPSRWLNITGGVLAFPVKSL